MSCGYSSTSSLDNMEDSYNDSESSSNNDMTDYDSGFINNNTFYLRNNITPPPPPFTNQSAFGNKENDVRFGNTFGGDNDTTDNQTKRICNSSYQSNPFSYNNNSEISPYIVEQQQPKQIINQRFEQQIIAKKNAFLTQW